MSILKLVKMNVRSVTSIDVKGKNSQTLGPLRSFKGSFQPSNGQDMQALPEGRRESSVFKIYSDKDFNNITSAENPDLILFNNVTYEIIHKEPWQNGLISHYKYFIQEKKDK